MIQGIVFCGRKPNLGRGLTGCNNLAVGTLIYRRWVKGSRAANEKRMPVCAEDRKNLESAILHEQATLPANQRIEVSWTDNLD